MKEITIPCPKMRRHDTIPINAMYPKEEGQKFKAQTVSDVLLFMEHLPMVECERSNALPGRHEPELLTNIPSDFS